MSALTSSGVATPSLRLVASSTTAPQAVEAARGRVGARAVALGQLVAQVGERALRAGAEGDRLLDLEVERHPPVVDAAPVLDRHEREEAQQLLGAARGLLGREGRRREAVEGAGGLRARRQERLAARQRRVAQAREGGAGARGGGRAAVLRVARGQDGEVALGLRRGLGAADRQVALLAAGGVVEQLAQARLVGVEQVLGDGGAGRAGAEPAGLQAPERDGGVGARGG